MTDLLWLSVQLIAAIPADREPSVCEWGREHVRLPGSARSERFDPDITPWNKTPLECCDDGVTRIVTYVKPVQAGGSVIGEVALCRWLSCHNNGDVQYNWETDPKGGKRWEKRTEKIFKACELVMQRAPTNPNKWKGGMNGAQVIFPHCNFTQQGVFTENNVASDSIRFQVNEEIHNWEAGRLAQAYNRTTAFWNSVIINISNAGIEGDQLHAAFVAGTQEHWEVKCPGCGHYHRMRSEWKDDEPEAGGLRYDSTGCKLPNGDYDYNKLEPTVRYQFPCGHQMRDEIHARRDLSLSGRYGKPENTGAHQSHRSFTLDAVSVDYIPWLKLISEKHEALRALRYGDPEPYKRYLQERECKFWNPENRPLVGKVILSGALKKNREGIEKRFARFFALDRQQGTLKDGELPHWWLVLRDADEHGNSQLVWEGKCLTDEDAIGVLREHGVEMWCGVADSGDDTTHVYQFCLRYGINAIKGTDGNFHMHPDGSRKIFSPEKPLHLMINAPPVHPYTLKPVPEWHEQKGRWISVVKLSPAPEEPLFWLYSRVGLLDRLAWVRSANSAVRWDVPGDVSEDYKKHMEAWELVSEPVGRSKQIQSGWRQVKKRDDLNKCEQYITMLMEMAGLIGERTK